MKPKIEFMSRNLDLIDKYYDLDKEKKLINVNLYYDSVYDILNNKIGNRSHYLFKDEVLETINKIITSSPVGYKININFVIDDYDFIDAKTLIASFNDTLELMQYQNRRERQIKELTASFLILIGIMLLFIMVLGKTYWFSSNIKGDIIYEVINIVAWVFVWEAATMYFLEHSKEGILALKIRARINNIAMYNNDTLLVEENSKNIFSLWDNEGVLKRVSKTITLITSIILIFMAFYSYYNLYIERNTFDNMPLALSITVLISIILILSGILGILSYLGHSIKNKYSIILPFIILVAILILLIIKGSILQIVSCSLALVVYIVFAVGYFMDKN